MTKADIAALSERIRDAFEIQIPANLDKLVSELGGSIRLIDSDESNGKEAYIRPLAVDDSGEESSLFEIGLQEDVSSSARRRFSIAHEIGHLFLHLNFLDENAWAHKVREGKVHYRYGSSYLENEAHEFAANLLMPEQEFRDAVSQETDDDGWTDLQNVATHFGVSYSAALNRGRWLGIFSWD